MKTVSKNLSAGERVFNAGYHARCIGLDLMDNPWTINAIPQHRTWENGWYKADRAMRAAESVRGLL